jgi:hypothetical protein
MSLDGGYLFLLGLACGIACLALTSYFRLTPRWVRWMLIASGVFVVVRYAALAHMAIGAAWPAQLLTRLWFGSAVGLTLPSAFAVDALIRHPAMTPKKLLIRFSPLLVLYAALAAFAQAHVIMGRPLGWAFAPTPVWQALAVALQGFFLAGFVGVCVLLIQRLPVPAIRAALLNLVVSHGYLGGLSLVMAAKGWWLSADLLLPEMLTLLAIWHAFQTADRLQAAGS